MMRYSAIIFILLIICTTSCSVRKYLPPGQRLYRGASATITKTGEVKASKRSLKKTVLQAAIPKPNKFFLGQPYKVWWWYFIGTPKREKGFKAFLRGKLGEPPVFASRVHTESAAENMAALMHNLGYFQTTVQGDTSNYSYFTKAKYTANVHPQYHLGKLEWIDDSSALIQTLKEEFFKNGFLKEGDPYTLSTFSAEYDRLDLYLKTKGYYYFNPSNIFSYVDSTVGDRKVNAIFNIKKTTPKIATEIYSMNDVTLYPNYSLDQATPDTARYGLNMYDGLFIQDSTKKFKNNLFANTVTYRPGDVYNSSEQNASLNRLINLGVFKFVKSRYERPSDTTNNLLNVFYYLTPLPKKSLQAQVDGFTKENNYFGTEVSVNWRNRNAFRGAEQLGIRAYGGLETTSGDSIKNSNYRLGSEVTLKVPRYVIPFFRINEKKFYPPNTTFLLGYEYFIRTLLYTKNLFRFNYEFTWKNNILNQFTFSPVALSYLSVTGVTDSFNKQLAANPSLKLNVYPEATVGSFFNYTYNSGIKSTINKWYFSGGADLAGNLLGLATGAKHYREKKIFGTPFAQYAKFDADLHYARRLNKNNLTLANRISFGIGLPYNNSKILPYGKLYTIGGANSLRGFRSRSLGPGIHKPTAEDQRFFQIIGGDLKLLANTEIRIPVTKLISTALFIDAGNIWTKDTILFGQEGKFTKDWFKQIAVSSGFGIRFDATILLIRADLGIPLRKPFLPEGQRWVLSNFDFGSAAWRRENLILNIALGLPF